jgi:hypothetical protein
LLRVGVLGVIAPFGLPVSGIIILRKGISEAGSPGLEFERGPSLRVTFVEGLLQRLL